MTDNSLNNLPPTPEVSDANNRSRNKKLITAVIVVLVVIALALVSAILVKHYVISTFIVNGVSMYPTLDGGNGAYDDGVEDNGEVLYLNKVAKIKRGDLVVFRPYWPDTGTKALVKRVIAVAGDTVKIQDNVLYLNGSQLNEGYINGPMANSPDIEITVPENSIFCMGDNRDHSNDCRVNGAVSLDTVIGKCFLIKGLDGKLRKP